MEEKQGRAKAMHLSTMGMLWFMVIIAILSEFNILFNKSHRMSMRSELLNFFPSIICQGQMKDI